MFCVVYSARAMAPAILDPELGINLALMVHGSQEFEWGEPVVAGDTITTQVTVADLYEKDGKEFYVWESESKNQDGATDSQGNLDEHREGRLMAETKTKLKPETGAELPALSVTPDKYVPHRYAGASGDFNPIHIDPEFAKAVGLPGNILHGLYTMAQVARAATAAGAGDPRSLKRLSVQFRGMGQPEKEINVTGSVKSAADGRVVVDVVAEQDGNQIIRNAEAELELA